MSKLEIWPLPSPLSSSRSWIMLVSRVEWKGMVSSIRNKNFPLLVVSKIKGKETGPLANSIKTKLPQASTKKFFKGSYIQTLKRTKYKMMTPIWTKEHSCMQAKRKGKCISESPGGQDKKKNKIGVILLFAS